MGDRSVVVVNGAGASIATTAVPELLMVSESLMVSDGLCWSLMVSDGL